MKGNRKGPENRGPKTGRGLGFCCGYNKPGCENDKIENGSRRGHGLGLGRRNPQGRRLGENRRSGECYGHRQGRNRGSLN
jgi:hypothetical protein